MGKTLFRLVTLSGAAFALLSLSLRPAYAWNGRGHEAVAALAYAQLTPAAKKAVEGILAADPRHRTLAQASVWPDQIRHDDSVPQADKHPARHYVDIPYTDGQAAPPPNTAALLGDPETVTAGIRLYAADLGSPATTDPQRRADDLSWLVHLVGDVHQPLHCTTRITAAEPLPAGDKGGNAYRIDAAVREPDGTVGHANNLHAFWDLAPDLSPTATTSDALAAELQASHPAALYPGILGARPADADGWALESYAFESFVYSTPEGKGVSPQYAATTYAITTDRLARAGYRLAAVLNGLFAAPAVRSESPVAGTTLPPCRAAEISLPPAAAGP